MGEYKSLPVHIQSKIDKQIDFLSINPRHKSLNFKKRKDLKNVWQVRVDKGYRMFGKFNDLGDFILYWVGPHPK